MDLKELINRLKGIKENSTIKSCIKDTLFVWTLRKEYLQKKDLRLLKRFFKTIHPSVCPLCKFYYNGGCWDCPIYKETGEVNCNGTPLGKLLHDGLDPIENYNMFLKSIDEIIIFLEKLEKKYGRDI